MIRIIIIDDEPSAVNVLSLILKKKCSETVEIVATSESPGKGIELIKAHSPDLVFLDIEMPGMTGIDLLRSFSNPTFHVIFVTAYDAYAVEAFRLSAIDYLLKPVESDDVVAAVNKITAERLRVPHGLTKRLEKLEELFRQKSAETKLAIGMADKIIFVQIPDIVYCEAQGAYTNIYLKDGRKMMASKSLGDFENQLSQHKFFRIHHHYLINLNQVSEFQRQDGGYVVMDNKQHLEVSQRKRKDFLQAIQDFLI